MTQDTHHGPSVLVRHLGELQSDETVRWFLLGAAGGSREHVQSLEDQGPSLKDTVFLVVGLKVFVHATGVGHLFTIDLWQELGVLDSLLLVEEDVRRVGVDLLGVHLLEREKHRIYNRIH